MDESTPPNQAKVTSETLARDTEAFLAKGGQIERLPTKRVAPKNKKWIARRGRDYTPWEKL